MTGHAVRKAARGLAERLSAGERVPPDGVLTHEDSYTDTIMEAPGSSKTPNFSASYTFAAHAAEVPVREVDRAELDALDADHRGVTARLVRAKPTLGERDLASQRWADDAVVVVLDGVEDPQNLGAAARSVEAAGASMLARCAEKDKFFPIIETLFQLQRQWAVEKPIPPLLAIAKQAGFTEQSFNACLSDQKMLDAMQEEQKRATDKFKVSSTPTLFVNGKMQKGGVSIDELAKVIDPLLKA